jgi:uncharacterized small protein (DUF1192 family)
MQETLKNAISAEKNDINSLSLRRLEREIKELSTKINRIQTELRKKKDLYDMLQKRILKR